MPLITMRRRGSGRWFAAALTLCCFAALSAPPSFAQSGGGSGGTAGATGVSPQDSPARLNAPTQIDRSGAPAGREVYEEPGVPARVQPQLEPTRQRLEQAGAALPPEERRETLRELNEITRDIAPPSVPVPAPRLEPTPRN